MDARTAPADATTGPIAYAGHLTAGAGAPRGRARAWLEAHDTRFDGETREIEGMVRLATFYDPDGNTLMLAQRLPAMGAPRVA